jgi:hypothetical protein
MVADRPPITGGLPKQTSQTGNGMPIYDPSANVLSLVEAANRRQDDLRDANDKLVTAELRHLHELAEVRAAHAREIRESEASRVNAIRQVDVTAVKTEADRALAAIQTLAATTAANAENLRNALNTTATTIANQTSSTVGAITERIAALEKSSYTGAGKEAVTDPSTRLLIEEVRSLREKQQVSTGRGEGINVVWLVVTGAVGFLATLLSMGVLVYTLTKAPVIEKIPAPATTSDRR